MYDVVALGELLIDFTPFGSSERGNQLFEQNPGGAPANVLAAISKLGKKGAFIGMVGQDQFGSFLREVLAENGIEVSGLKFSKTYQTTLAFVHLDQDGDRSFSFYRNPGADLMLSSEDVDYDLIKKAKIFHFGSVSMTKGPSRETTLAAAKFAKEKGLIVSYDPNYRPPLWNNITEAKTVIKSGLKYVDILKVSQEELELITGTNDLDKGTASLYEQGIQVIFVTLGPEGCYYRYPGGIGKMATYKVKVVDTTGAGDAFLGGILYWFSQLTLQEIYKLSLSELRKIINFANGMGALTTTKKGGIPALPSLEEVNLLIGNLHLRKDDIF
ncbi:MAG TPA: carbohydrate kinase [Firmicutes bacterium]|nr:carbohydrate kinase [Bacillota bacterium]